MSDIPNTEYITVKRDKKGQVGIFVGGKPATKYRGEDIYDIEYVKNIFKWMQGQNSEIAEFHIMSSETRGKHAVAGNPSEKHGPNAWCRAKFNNGRVSPWVFVTEYYLMNECASRCAYQSLDNVRISAQMRSAVLGTPDHMIKALKDVDLSKCVGKPVQLNGYEIIVRKIAETQQIKR